MITLVSFAPDGHIGSVAGNFARGVGETLPKTLTDQPALVIEDEAVIAWMVEDILETLGFTEIMLAANPTQALTLAQQQAPGLIVSDINLGAGHADGVDTVTQILDGATTPVLFISGHADANAVSRIHQGVAVSRTLRKPVSREELSNAVKALAEVALAN